MNETIPVNVVSFCIPERNEAIEDQAIENAKILSEVFPDWKGYFYIKHDVDESVIKTIAEQPNCSAFVLDEAVVIDGSYWQYIPLTESNEVSAFISRDCRELITKEDYVQACEWLKSPQQFFCVREAEDLEVAPIRPFHWGARIHGPVNTMWLFHYLSQSEFLQSHPEYPKEAMLLSFYNGFSFLFEDIISNPSEEPGS